MALAVLTLLVGCYAAARTPPQGPSATATAAAEQSPAASRLPDAVHWVRNSAEYRAAVRQAYRLATSRIEQSATGRRAGTWAVIVDADETVLDNSDYQKERAGHGLGFTRESWRAWVARQEARAVPGAPDFLRRVHELGGRVAVVTNRTEVECPDTEVNLRDQGLAADVVLCRPEAGPSDKQPRFTRVANGTAASGVPPLDVLMWVGDNILDFPGLTQDVRDDPVKLAEFGSRFILIPNPMYGSWEKNPRK